MLGIYIWMELGTQLFFWFLKNMDSFCENQTQFSLTSMQPIPKK